MYDINNINIGKRIRELRKEKHLSLEELGLKTNKAKSTIYKYEEGSLEPDLTTLLLLANTFDINVEGFFNKENTHITTRDINPFNTDKLYMYYTGNNSIIISIIVIENLTYQKATFYNGVTSNSINSSRFMKYTGTLQAEKDDAYFIFETDEKSDFEKVLVQVKLPQKATNKYYGYIASDKSAEKCIILDRYIDNEKELKKLLEYLKVTDEEIEHIKRNQYWNIDISIEKDIRKKFE